MKFNVYLNYFEEILNNSTPSAPYDHPDYFNYTKLNWVRMNRWLKHAVLSEEIKKTVSAVNKPQHWIVITEPWCGDAAHIVPFLHLIAELNPLIRVEYELRDSAPFRINEYLTNGGKSIPKLIIRNEAGEDLGVWGPRPVICQTLFDKLKADQADFETMKTELQKWYNKDEGKEIMSELTGLIKQSISLS